MGGIIIIDQEPPSDVVRRVEGLGKLTNSYSFKTLLRKGFSPYEQFNEEIEVRASIDKVLDNHAILKISRRVGYISTFSMGGGREPHEEHRQYGCVDVSDPKEIDRRLHGGVVRELDRIRSRGYEFEVDDATKFGDQIQAS
jgi:hypothetical protein